MCFFLHSIHFSLKTQFYLSHVMRKHAYAICEQQSADQPAHLHSLISTFVVHCLDSIIYLVSTVAISWLELSRLVGVLPGLKSGRQVFSWHGSFYSAVMILSIQANSVDPDQIRLKELSDQGLHCLPFCLHPLDTLLLGKKHNDKF